MAVPKKKQSKARTRKRAANWKAQPSTYAECPQCHQAKLPHVVCGLRLLRRPKSRRGRVAGAAWGRVAGRSRCAAAAGTGRAARSHAGRRFHDAALREAALSIGPTRSNRARLTNERLEFLGDAVLGLVVTDLAFTRFPDLSEGPLAKLRAAMVNMQALAEVAVDSTWARYALGDGEQLSGGRDKASILADGLEAVLGAVYLDRGLTVTRDRSRSCSGRAWRRTPEEREPATTRRSCRNLPRRTCAECPNTT